MERIEDWAVDCDRIAAFFRSLPDVMETEGSFRAHGCEILLTRLDNRRVGSLSFPQTRVLLRGEEDAVQSMYRRFFMRFISAGG